MKDKSLKKAELENIQKMVAELIEYVSEVFDVDTLKKVRQDTQEKLGVLKGYKIALEKLSR